MTPDIEKLRALCNAAPPYVTGIAPAHVYESLRAALPEALDEIERLTKERDELAQLAQAGANQLGMVNGESVDEYRTAIRDLQSRGIDQAENDPFAVLLAAYDKLRAAWERVGEVLADEGCNCDETDEHNRPVELSDEDRCFGHRIESAWRSEGGK